MSRVYSTDCSTLHLQDGYLRRHSQTASTSPQTGSPYRTHDTANHLRTSSCTRRLKAGRRGFRNSSVVHLGSDSHRPFQTTPQCSIGYLHSHRRHGCHHCFRTASKFQQKGRSCREHGNARPLYSGQGRPLCLADRSASRSCCGCHHHICNHQQSLAT